MPPSVPRGEKRLRILVAMSGGVDSAIAAYLLHRAGHQVIGVTLHLFGPADTKPADSLCGDARSIEEARRSAEIVGIPHLVLDKRESFRKLIIDDFIVDYAAADTPNPCVRCNPLVKLASLQEEAERRGFDAVATGHYVRRLRCETPEDGWGLYRGRDRGKDQSYVLWGVDRDKLERCLFPLGDAHKASVRRLARKLGLPAWDRPESQDICFLPGGKPIDLLGKRFNPDHPMRRPGPIRTNDGKKIGEHNGLLGYTIGQRKGIGVGGGTRLYVTRIDPEIGTLWVGPREEGESEGLLATGGNLLAPASLLEGSGITAQIRYRHRGVGCDVKVMSKRYWGVHFDRRQVGVAPGQSVVFYRGDRLLGGARIESAIP